METIDPEMKAILDRRNALGLPGFAQGTPEDARRGFAAAQAALPPRRGPAMRVERDETIAGPRGPVPIRRYVAHDGAPAARILYCHGGGWVFGTLDGFDPVCRLLAQRTGAEIVSVDYRLAPEHPFPAPLDDAWAALTAVAGDGPLAVMGDSAGGNLAAAMALRARDRGGPHIALQVLLYPVLSPDFSRGSYQRYGGGDYLISGEDMRWFWDQHVPDASRDHPEAAPLAAGDLAGLPASIVVVAGCDPLRDEGIAYAEALRAAGNEAILREHPGMAHGFCTLIDLLGAANAEIEAIGELIRARLA